MHDAFTTGLIKVYCWILLLVPTPNNAEQAAIAPCARYFYAAAPHSGNLFGFTETLEGIHEILITGAFYKLDWMLDATTAEARQLSSCKLALHSLYLAAGH